MFESKNNAISYFYNIFFYIYNIVYNNYNMNSYYNVYWCFGFFSTRQKLIEIFLCEELWSIGTLHYI